MSTMTKKVTKEDIKETIMMIQFESGEIIMISDKDNKEDAERKSCKVVDNIIDDGNKVRSIGVKVILQNGDWIKTDGTNVASKNVTDAHFTEYLVKVVDITRPLYLETFNNEEVFGAVFKLREIDRDLMKLSIEYGY